MANIDWFNSSQRRGSIKDFPGRPSVDSSVPSSPPDDGATPGRPSQQPAITAPLSTPHDAALSLLTGVPKDTDTDVPRDAIPLSRDGSASGPREDTSTQDLASAQSPPMSSTVENVYDPFTGNVAGVLYPRSPDQFTSTTDSADVGSRKKGSLQFDNAKDSLWTHLARIRDLQSEIAGMHVHMEGIKPSDGGRGGQKRPAGQAARMHTDTIGAGDEWVDAEQEAKAREKARDAEFTKLAESFEGRRAAIDDIMEKLDDLSRTLTTFHALPTPQIDSLFRTNTKDSSTTSPILRSPSPMFTNPASSPPPGSPPPMSPTSPPPDYDFGVRSDALSPMSESPVSEDGRP
ncbi:hypothetical protein EIP91_000556 [Steccherinum ochraceum]|uniref:Uncharacterized protein n=1 Tax=Steccherinum ochraceum TaxID=92696 RepID=A0A4R0RJN9_9APHY|nr:hypothetical protein EIP91_000556 [Steccherinum ochraceum]